MTVRKVSERLLEELFKFNIVAMPFEYIMAVVSDCDMGRVLSLWCFWPLILYHYFLRHKVKKMTPFLIFTFVTVVLCLFIPATLPQRVVYGIFTGLFAVHSFRKRTGQSEVLFINAEVIAYSIAFDCFFYVLASRLENINVREIYFYRAILIFVFAIIYTHLQNLNVELELDEPETLRPIKNIKAFTNKMLFMYVFVFFAVCLGFRFLPFGDIIIYCVKAVGSFIGFFITLFSLIFAKKNVVDETAVQDMQPAVMEVSKAPSWVDVLEQLLVYAVNIAAVLIILFSLVWFFIRMYRAFYSYRHKSDVIYTDSVSKITIVKTKKKIRASTYIKDPLRRKYYNLLKKYYKKGRFQRSDTPEEIEKKISENEDIKKITPEYRKIRYKGV